MAGTDFARLDHLLEIALPDAEARTRQAIDAIQAYLARWPLAADVEHGIAQWWLPAMGVYVPRSEVREALERLVQMNAIERTTLPDGSVIYRRASRRA